jgi:beta-aspartyl-peptidase (threonine type)
MMLAIAVHGGAGTLPPSELTPERQGAFRVGLESALRAGFAVLESGGSSLDAVVAAVLVLEDDPLFNAGRGSVLAANGEHELDASVMDGRDLRAGSVTGLRHVRNPVLLARLVMDRSPHVMLAGGEAVLGTVGAVALDSAGNLAAATSTGGMTGKKWGRVGDSPIIGAGTYAANDCCAVSATGHGEYFIRAAVAHEIASLMRYRGLDVRRAADEVVTKQLVKIGGSGGVIAIGRDGAIAMPFNSPGMLRGAMDSSGRLETGIQQQ